MARTLNELQKQYNASSSQTGAAGGFMRGPGGWSRRRSDRAEGTLRLKESRKTQKIR